MMSTWCSRHVEAYNKLIKKEDFSALSWLIAMIFNVNFKTLSSSIKSAFVGE